MMCLGVCVCVCVCVCVWTQLLEIVCLGLLSNLSSFQLSGFTCGSAVCALQESVPQSCVSSGGSMVGITVTSSKRAYATPRSAAPRAPAPAAGHCGPYLLRRHSTQFCLSLCGVFGSWCTQGTLEPSEGLWRVWGLILNLVKAMFFPGVMYGCESWTIRKAERWRIDTFELLCWRLSRVPWPARTANQPILKEISPEHSLEGLMLKLKLQYFGHLMWWTEHLKRLWCWERLKAEGKGDNRGWDGWMASSTQWMWVWVATGVGDGQEGLECCSLCGLKESYKTEWFSLLVVISSLFSALKVSL